VQDECEQVDNTTHCLGLCSKKPPKADVTISVWGGGRMDVSTNSGQFSSSSREGGGLLQVVDCDLLHQLLTPLHAKQDAKASRVTSSLLRGGQSK